MSAPDAPVIPYSVTVTDGDEPIPAMQLSDTEWIPGAQDSGRTRWNVSIAHWRRESFEAALNADPAVIAYEYVSQDPRDQPVILDPLPSPCRCGHDHSRHASRIGSHGNRTPCDLCGCGGFRIASRSTMWRHLIAYQRRIFALESANRRLAFRQYIPAAPYFTRYSFTAEPGIQASITLENRTRIRLSPRDAGPLITVERFDADGATRAAYAIVLSPNINPEITEAIARRIAALELSPPDEAPEPEDQP